MRNNYFMAAMLLFIMTIISCKSGEKTAKDTGTDTEKDSAFVFIMNDYKVGFSDTDKAFLIKKYKGSEEESIDTLPWPPKESTQKIILKIDVSGTMFMKQFGVIKNGKPVPFFHYSLAKLMAYFRDNNSFDNVSEISIVLFGSKPQGQNISMDESIDIEVPKGRLMVHKYFYSANNNETEIDVTGYEKPKNYEIYTVVEKAIMDLTKPYRVEESKVPICVRESPLLEDIVINCSNLKDYPGKKSLIYMTDGYFKINSTQELTPGSATTLVNLKEQFGGLQQRIPKDKDIQFLFFGMNTVDNLQFRDKLNGFYEWYLNNNVKIINLR
jgi:hypothetical protein